MLPRRRARERSDRALHPHEARALDQHRDTGFAQDAGTLDQGLDRVEVLNPGHDHRDEWPKCWLRDDGSIVIELAVTNRAAFRSWRLGLLDHARVLGPEALVADERAWLTAIVDGAA